MGKSNLRLKPHQIERVGRLKVMLVEQEIRLGISARFSAKLNADTSAKLAQIYFLPRLISSIAQSTQPLNQNWMCS